MKNFAMLVLGFSLVTPVFAGTSDCVPGAVGFMDSSGARVYVRCNSSVNDGGQAINHFALPAIEPESSNRLLELAQNAMNNGRILHVQFLDGDTSGAIYGCAAHNCRRPIGFHLLK